MSIRLSNEIKAVRERVEIIEKWIQEQEAKKTKRKSEVTDEEKEKGHGRSRTARGRR